MTGDCGQMNSLILGSVLRIPGLLVNTKERIENTLPTIASMGNAVLVVSNAG